MDDVDVAHLRRCLDFARLARDGGNEPFGSLLVNGDGEVVAERMNTVGGGDITGHPELALAAWASLHMTAAEREKATLYTSCESCAMCAGGHYWVGIGRLVFALSGEQLVDIVPPAGRSLRLSSREVFAAGTRASRWKGRVNSSSLTRSRCSTASGRDPVGIPSRGTVRGDPRSRLGVSRPHRRRLTVDA